MKVDDAVLERVKERRGLDAVVAGVDHQLDAMRCEEIAYGGVALLGRCERPLRQIAHRDAPLASEGRTAA
jgi:hypothetical protein